MIENIEGYPEYHITKDGRVYSHKRNKFLSLIINSHGYKHVNLCRHNPQTNKVERKVNDIHRMVAKAYIPNPNNLPQVDHIDENKTNNNVTNLQWITTQGNVEKEHSYYWLVEKVSTGEQEWIYNMKKWCREKGLDNTALTNTYRRHLDPNNVNLPLTSKGYKVIGRREEIFP